MAFSPDVYRRIFEGVINAGTFETNYVFDPDAPLPTTTVVATNTIQLAAGASTANDYYVGYDIILYKTLADGSTYTQKKRIQAYDGTSQVAVIDDIWDSGYEPELGDTYDIVLAYADARVTTNPVMQLADYITSVRYGRNFDPEADLFLDQWRVAARKCDGRSDVTIKVNAAQSVVANDVYELLDGARIVFEGVVTTTESTQYVKFTDVLGKITHYWRNWKSYELGDIVYTEDNNFYKVTGAGVKSTKPTHTAGTTNGLEYITSLTLNRKSGTGPATLTVPLSKNPVRTLNSEGAEVSGYSLYDADSVTYWRRLGWDEHSQDWATLYQTNHTIDTSSPLFDNINMMLEHCNGIFSYSEGRYGMRIEDIEDTFTDIGLEDIIGKIQYKDSGTRTSYNSVSVSYSDPGNNFESRNISLYSKKFLKQDRNVPKKGNITVTGMTNYYNVRLLADSYLKKSRFSGTITMTLVPEFITLTPGDVIQLTYPRFGWTNKRFRVDSMTINEDCTIQVVAKEYDESFYNLTNMSTVPGVGEKAASTDTVISAPTNVTATSAANSNEIKDGIRISWTNTAGLSTGTDVEIYSSPINVDTLTVTDIASNQLTFSTTHGLEVGDIIRSTSSGNGLVNGASYFVKTVVNTTTIELSETYLGPVLTLTNGSGLARTFSPYTLIGTVAYPTSSFLDTFPSITGTLTRYYKVRYKTRK